MTPVGCVRSIQRCLKWTQRKPKPRAFCPSFWSGIAFFAQFQNSNSQSYRDCNDSPRRQCHQFIQFSDRVTVSVAAKRLESTQRARTKEMLGNPAAVWAQVHYFSRMHREKCNCFDGFSCKKSNTINYHMRRLFWPTNRFSCKLKSNGTERETRNEKRANRTAEERLLTIENANANAKRRRQINVSDCVVFSVLSYFRSFAATANGSI